MIAIVQASMDVANSTTRQFDIQVGSGLIVGIVLMLAGYIFKKNRDFYRTVNADHVLLKSHVIEISSMKTDIKTMKDDIKTLVSVSSDTNKNVKRNGGNSDSNGDTTYRIEQAITKLTEALVSAGIVKEDE